MVGVAQELGARPAPSEDVRFALVAGERALFADGDLRAARRWFETAYRQAEPSGDAEALARAALGLSGIWVHEHRTSAKWTMVRERQRRALGPLDPRSPLAFRLRARLAGEEDYRAGEHGRILVVLGQARAAGDPVALAEALSLAHHCLLGPEHAELRLPLAEELIGVAALTGRRSDLLMGLMWRAVDLFKAADPHAERSFEELQGLLAEDHLAVGFVAGAIEVMLSTRAGRFEEAEALAGACAQRGTVAGDVDATGWYGGQLGAIRWYQGRIAELRPSLVELASSPTLSAVDNSQLAGLAVASATAGDHRAAAGLLARLRGRDLAHLPRSSSWLATMYGIVEAAYLLRDAGTAARAHALLAPFAGLPVVAGLGVTCFGSVRHSLGTAMLAVGDLDRAVEHLRGAVHDNLALGHWPAAVLSRHRLARALALRDGPRDEAAREEAAAAAREAKELGMTLPAEAGAADRAGGAPARLLRHGKQWLLEWGGRSVLVADSVGTRHLAVLIANPGREIPATDLAAGTRAPESATASPQPLLDAAARDAYKQRLTHLQAEIDELESMNDMARAAALRLEHEWLVAELASATGINGRTRAFTGSQERARIAVGKAIRRAVSRVAEADPAIGEELRVTVHTGLRCSYLPR
ncbi:hypothetical protein [Nonomuraea sp. LPB2021202275-12-8]|uniref:hypothetical protein n=1 Tax=Nonomuraea sp. LPB2021202275-12-8 TaxID=3120159 RepID=UPI00300CC595